MQRAAEQLEAAREVAQLEYQLAQSSLEAVQTRIDAKTGTLHELADARVQAAERYLLFQDADFEYQRVRLNLLRATGELESWALPGPASNDASKEHPAATRIHRFNAQKRHSAKFFCGLSRAKAHLDKGFHACGQTYLNGSVEGTLVAPKSAKIGTHLCH